MLISPLADIKLLFRHCFFSFSLLHSTHLHGHKKPDKYDRMSVRHGGIQYLFSTKNIFTHASCSMGKRGPTTGNVS